LTAGLVKEPKNRRQGELDTKRAFGALAVSVEKSNSAVQLNDDHLARAGVQVSRRLLSAHNVYYVNFQIYLP
jgi:hypothetical protein